MLTVREKIGEDLYTKIENEAQKEVSLAMQFEIIDKYKQDRYYTRRPILTELLSIFEEFQNKEFKFSPLDIFNIFFNAKLLKACDSEQEYIQRRGGGLITEEAFSFSWYERENKYEEVVDEHLTKLEACIIERTLISEITDFNTHPNMGDASEFLKQLFVKLQLPFTAEIDSSQQKSDRGTHQPEKGRVSFTATGTNSYVYYYAQAHLRSFLNVLRIGGFLNRGQIDFGMWGVVIMAPTTPYFLNTNYRGGVYSWEEDKRKPWEKIPDGCLFLSFGYRGITTLFLDNRSFAGIEKIFLDNILVFKYLSNPWTEKSTVDITTSLDILSIATQTPDLGAKILQIYCCLEHLFVPKNIQKGNIKHIVGGINVLRPDLLPWFDRLYKIRCDYAHKGYIQKDEKTLGLVFESVENTISLLNAKLKQGQ